MLNDNLLNYLTPGPERGGIVLADGTAIELENISSDEDGYQVDPCELLPWIEAMVGTWHSHPNQTANLSVEDQETFLLWPDLTHYIVGDDGVRAYRVKNNLVINV
jgi:proteasome lid subunit RPN8/RPN11